MTYAETVAAEIAARYGVPVMPGAFQRIPRGVSGLPDPLEPVSMAESRKRYMAQHYNQNGNRARAARLRKAEEKAQAALAPRPEPKPKREVMSPEECRAKANAYKADARARAATATAERLRAMAGAKIEDAAAALGFTVQGVKKLAAKIGVDLIGGALVRDRRRKMAPEEKAANAARKQAKDDAVRALADGVRTRPEIARLAGCSLDRVYKVLVGYTVLGQPKPMTTAPEEVQAAINDGLTLAQIAQRFNCSPSTISERIKEHKLTRPPAPPKAPKPKSVSDYRAAKIALAERIRAAAKDAPSIAAVARITGIKRQTVQRHFSAMGLTVTGLRTERERDAAIYADWCSGTPYRVLADRYGVSKSNIHRIVTREKAEAA